MLKLKKNLSAGVLSCILGIAYWFLIPIGIDAKVEIETNAVGPEYMPRLISVLLIVLGAMLIVQSVVLKKDEVFVWNFHQEKPVLLYLAVLFGLIVLIPLIGFLVSSIVAAVLFLLLMQEKNKWFYGIVLAICILIYVIFRFALGIPLP